LTVSTSAQKSARVAERKRTYNKPVRSSLKTQVKVAKSLIDSKDKEKAGQAVNAAISAMDRAAQKKVIHRNTAGRQKSRLMAKLQKIEVAEEPKKGKKKQS
jgi:small subunit ribosomal protein S20